MKPAHLITALAVGYALMALVSFNALAQAHGAHTMVTPGELKWQDVPSLPPGAKIAVIEGPMNQAVPFTARLKFPPNYRIPAHSHPAIEHVTVLSGTFYMGMGDKLDTSKGMALPPGGIGIMPAGSNHFAYTTNEETIVQLHGVGPWGIKYVNPADDPRSK
jgi:quercetin dioxygenase-like cupin family protein